MKQCNGTQLRAAMSARPVITEQQKQNVELAEKVLDKLFDNLKAIFLAWRSAIPTPAQEKLVKLTWLKAFKENGIQTPQQIAAGLKVARQSGTPFMPSVGQFISWIKSADFDRLGMPDFEQYDDKLKKLMACAGKFDQKHGEYVEKYGKVSDLEYWLLLDGYNAVKASDTITVDNNVRVAYDKWAQKLRKGEQVPPQRVLIEATSERKSTQAEIDAAIKQARAERAEMMRKWRANQ